MPDLVLVTGASGFIAEHCIAELASRGYAVRGTVRRPGSAAHLSGLAELVPADLESDAGWAEAVAGCRYVLHVASPSLSFDKPDDPDGIIRSAVQGTLRVLRASAASGTVRRVVLTSSIVTIRPANRGGGRTFTGGGAALTEDDWCDPDASDDVYQKSKTLAERAAWEFVRDADSGLELAVINPTMVLGPLMHNAVNISLEPVRRLLAREIPRVPRLGWVTVDVRDVAVAHRLAMESPVAAGNRYICAGPHAWMSEAAQILAAKYRVPTKPAPYWLVWLLARFDPATRGVLGNWGIRELVSADKAKRDLGWTTRPLSETLLDTAAALIEHQVVTSA
jgi:dihydroflavonol-4-reductase